MKRHFVLVTLALSVLTASGGAVRAGSDLYSLPVVSVDGTQGTLAPFATKALLIVNTASQCGYTSQYRGLQKLSKDYAKRGLVVLGFPSNDFGGQEPGSNQEIKRFCKLNFRISLSTKRAQLRARTPSRSTNGSWRMHPPTRPSHGTSRNSWWGGTDK